MNYYLLGYNKKSNISKKIISKYFKKNRNFQKNIEIFKKNRNFQKEIEIFKNVSIYFFQIFLVYFKSSSLYNSLLFSTDKKKNPSLNQK